MTDLLFEVDTPLGVRVRATPAYWARIVTFKHPVMAGREDIVRSTLALPDEIRQSKSDESVCLYYGSDSPYIVCVVVKVENSTGFIITAYRTEAIKEGVRLWPAP